jgi:hypothetical protein
MDTFISRVNPSKECELCKGLEAGSSYECPNCIRSELPPAKIKNEYTGHIEESFRSQLNCLSFGLVAYAVKSYYTDSVEENRKLPMPIDVNDFMTEIEKVFNLKLGSNNSVKNILAGHEYGKENGKCHYQAIIYCKCITRISRDPGEFKFNDITIIYMYQAAKNHKALANYCKKEGHFAWLYSNELELTYKRNSKGVHTEKVDVYASIVGNRSSLTLADAKELLFKHDPRTAITSLKNIEYALTDMIHEEVTPFTWMFPEHLLNRSGFEYKMIYKWFNDFCIKDPPRKKALLLYSKERALGKTTFCKSLVSDERYSVVFRNTFSPMEKGKEPRLLILDDMHYTGTGDKLEMWKALVAGETTTIREAYCNYNWNYNVPCIITTNIEGLVVFLMSSPHFNTQIVAVEVTEYMGPPDTRPECLSLVECSLSDSVYSKIKAKQDKSQTDKFEDFTVNSQLRQRIKELEDTLLGFKKKRNNI